MVSHTRRFNGKRQQKYCYTLKSQGLPPTQHKQKTTLKTPLLIKKEYYYNPNTKERIDIAIWLNGLPIIVLELKHEDEGQDVNDAIFESFLKRDLKNPIYNNPFCMWH
jgi:Type I restriction enzyme R protein N terminus (HSDR_N).